MQNLLGTWIKLEVEMTKMVTFKFGEINVKVDEQYLDDFQYFAANALYHLENEGSFRKPINELRLSHLEAALENEIEYLEADKEEWKSGLEDEYSGEDLENVYQSTLEHFRSLRLIFAAEGQNNYA